MLTPPKGPNAAFYLSVVQALRELQQPQKPQPVFACATVSMPPAEDYPNGVLRNTTLNILAHSDGVNWRREDTGAII